VDILLGYGRVRAAAAFRVALGDGGPGVKSWPHCAMSNAREESMDPVEILIWLAIGAIAGWLAGQLVRGGGYGLIGNIVVGIVGAVIAGYLLPRLGISLGAGFVRSVISAFIGACLLLAVVRLVKR